MGEPALRARVRVRWGWLLLAAALALSSFGFVLNDEHDQATALHNLLEGRLHVTERPDALRAVGPDQVVPPRTGGDFAFASLPLNLLAVPVAGVLWTVDQVVPVRTLAGLAFTASIVGAFVPRTAWTQARSKPLPAAGAIAAAAAVAWWATGGFTAPSPSLRHHLPTVALQATNLGLLLAAAWLMHRLAKRHVADPLLQRIAVTTLTLGPLLFWSQTAKYHTLAVVLALAILVHLDRPTRRTRLVVGLLAGLAVWNHLGAGLVTLAAAAASFLPRTLREHRPLAWTAAVTGLSLGLAPWFLENLVLHGHPLLNHYLDPPPPWGAEASPASGARPLALAAWSPWLLYEGGPTVRERLVDALDWEGPALWAKRVAGAWTTGAGVQGPAAGLVAISPLLGLGLAALARGRWTRSPAGWFAAGLLLVQALLFANAAAYQGAGYDPRMWTIALPGVAYLALPALAAAGRRLVLQGRTVLVTTTIGTAAVLGLASLMTAAGQGFAPGGTDAEHLRIVVLLTALLSAATAMGAVLGGGRSGASVALGALLVPSLVWLACTMGVLHTDIPAWQGSEGAGMMVAGTEPLWDALRDAMLPDKPVPRVHVEPGPA